LRDGARCGVLLFFSSFSLSFFLFSFCFAAFFLGVLASFPLLAFRTARFVLRFPDYSSPSRVSRSRSRFLHFGAICDLFLAQSSSWLFFGILAFFPPSRLPAFPRFALRVLRISAYSSPTRDSSIWARFFGGAVESCDVAAVFDSRFGVFLPNPFRALSSFFWRVEMMPRRGFGGQLGAARFTVW
jgi:hypothetical protein